MTDTMARPNRSETIDAPAVTWATPGNGLWVASRADDDGLTFLGFVEESLEEFVAVDGAGASLGRYPDLAAAQASFSMDDAAPIRDGWDAAGATLVRPSRLRLG